MENCTTITRIRADIRKFKHTKLEKEALEIAHKHLEVMRKEFMRSDHYTKSSGPTPVEFEVPQDYDENKTSSPAAERVLDMRAEPAEEKPQPQKDLPQ